MRRRVTLLAALVLTSPVLVAGPSADAAGPGSTVLVDRPSGTGPVPSDAVNYSILQSRQSVSGNGRYVVFESDSDGLLPAGADRSDRQVFLHDRTTGTTTVVSTTSGGTLADNGAYSAAVSLNGTKVAFKSTSTNLVTGASGVNVFVKDLASGSVTLVSRATGANGAVDGTAYGDPPAISADGSRVAWTTSRALDGVADTNGNADVYLRNLATDVTTLQSRASGAGGAVGTGSSGSPSISADGGTVAFATENQLAAADGNSHSDVYARAGSTTLLVSLNAAGTAAGDGPSTYPSVNSDGFYVAFDSTATNLVASDANGVGDVFFRDLGAGTTALVSRPDGSASQQLPAESFGAVLSSDGSRVGFSSYAASGRTQGYVRTRGTNQTALVTRATGAGGAEADGYASLSSLDTDGSVAVFGTDAGNLGGPDRDTSQVYVRDGDLTSVVPPGQVGGAVGSWSGSGVSDDGRWAVFASDSDGLATDDNDTVTNVYLRDLRTGQLRTLTPGADGGSEQALISADGRTVVYETSATNVGAGPGLNAYDVATGATELASRADGPAGAPLPPDEYPVAISGNGRRIAFGTDVALDPAHDTNGDTDVYVRDLDAKTTQLVSRATGAGTGAGNGTSYGPSLDFTGNRIAFMTTSSDLGDGDAGNGWDVHVRDLAASTTTLVSRPSGSATPGDAGSFSPAISGDGTRVAFESAADNLDGGASTFDRVFLRDLAAGTTRLVSRVGADGASSDGNARNPDLSTDGSTVAFVSDAPNLGVPAAVETAVVVRTLATGQNVLASRADGASGALAQDVSGPTLTGTGSCVLFNAYGSGFSAYASPDFSHVYLRVLSGECPPAVVTPPPPPPGDTTAPVLRKVKLSKNAFRAGKGKGAGTKLGFKLSEAATVTLSVGKRSVTVSGKPGRNRTFFRARFGKKTLAPGRYKLLVRAVDQAGNASATVKLRFRVLPPA